MSAAAFQIGAGPDDWPGLAKLVEECGEATAVAAQLIAFPGGDRPDDDPTPLDERLADEIADLLAAADYMMAASAVARFAPHIQRRRADKLRRFQRWHREAS